MAADSSSLDSSKESSNLFEITRRDLLAGFLTGSLSPYALKAGVNSYVHDGTEYKDPSARAHLAHKPAIENLYENNYLKLHVVDLGAESDFLTGYNSTTIEQELEKLYEGLDVDVYALDVDLPESYISEVQETTVKSSKVICEDIRKYLEDERSFDAGEEDIVMYLGGFNSDTWDYVGTAHAGNNSGAVAHKKSDKYTINQILHNTGHKLSLPHTFSEDVMTWSVHKAIFSPFKVFSFQQESKNNLERSFQHHLD